MCRGTDLMVSCGVCFPNGSLFAPRKRGAHHDRPIPRLSYMGHFPRSVTSAAAAPAA